MLNSGTHTHTQKKIQIIIFNRYIASVLQDTQWTSREQAADLLKLTWLHMTQRPSCSGWRLSAVTSSRASLESRESRLTIKQHNSLLAQQDRLTNILQNKQTHTHSYVWFHDAPLNSMFFCFLHPLIFIMCLLLFCLVHRFMWHFMCCGFTSSVLYFFIFYLFI